LYNILLEIIAPVFSCALIGFIWARSESKYDIDMVTDLVTKIGTPCLIFFTLVTVEIDEKYFFQMALASVVSTLGFAVAGYFCLKLIGLKARELLPATIFGNVGNMGLPLSLFAFGQEGLALSIIYFTVNIIFLFTMGPAITIGDISFKKIIRLPFLYSIAIAVLFIHSDFPAPTWLIRTTKLLGDMMIPLMLITLGVSLAGLKQKNLTSSFLVSIIRLVCGFLVGCLTAELLDLNSISKGIVIMQSTMPVAVFNYLIAQKYSSNSNDVAGAVIVSTCLSFLTLPLLLDFIL
tara:strand:- start:1555 stop:2430 length:876 start_codon:yes stop_codon:yes gene_type:complete